MPPLFVSAGVPVAQQQIGGLEHVVAKPVTTPYDSLFAFRLTIGLMTKHATVFDSN